MIILRIPCESATFGSVEDVFPPRVRRGSCKRAEWSKCLEDIVRPFITSQAFVFPLDMRFTDAMRQDSSGITPALAKVTDFEIRCMAEWPKNYT
jgi:hypothetical protein